MRRGVIQILVLLSFAAASAHAREVHLQWDAIDGATAYEFEIRRNEQAVVTRRVEAAKTSWDVRLPVGKYVFRLRAIDWTGQAGEWSEPTPLVVEPPPTPVPVAKKPEEPPPPAVTAEKQKTDPPAAWELGLNAFLSFFKLGLRDQVTNGQAILVSQLVGGADLDLVRKGVRWGQVVRLGLASAALQSVPGRTVSTNTNVLLNLEAGLLWKPFRTRGTNLQLTFGGGHVALVRAGSSGDLSLNPGWVYQMGLRLTLPLLRGPGYEVRVVGAGSGIFSRGGVANQMVRHGATYGGWAEVEGEVLSGVSTRALLGYRGVWLNTTAFESMREDLFAGMGIVFKW